jgi:catalase
MSSKQSSKQAHLDRDTVEMSEKCPMNTDFGVKISDPDHWLRVVDSKHTGPPLLEDSIAREKVRHLS